MEKLVSKRKNFGETITDSMIRTAKKFYTQEEYLAFERASLEKHEYYQGEIFDMAGGSLNHSQLQMNFTGEVRSFLKEKKCKVHASELRVHIPLNTLYTYPDSQIICGEVRMLDDAFDTVMNPVVIIEILSKSTQSYDRGDKFMLYRSIQTLKEYILIDSLSIKVEYYIRQQNEDWLLKEYSILSDAFHIQSINYHFPLVELYAGVEL